MHPTLWSVASDWICVVGRVKRVHVSSSVEEEEGLPCRRAVALNAASISSKDQP